MEKYMKKNKCLYLVMIIVFIFLTSFIIILFNKKIFKYVVFDGVVFSDSLIVLMVDKDELKLFYTNSYVFVNNKKIKFEVHRVDNDILKRGNKYYSEIYLKVKINNYKENDVIKISVLEEKVYSYKMFKIIWR